MLGLCLCISFDNFLGKNFAKFSWFFLKYSFVASHDCEMNVACHLLIRVPNSSLMVLWMFSVHSQLHCFFISRHRMFRATSASAVSDAVPTNMQDTHNNATHYDILQENYCVTGKDQIPRSKYTVLCVCLACISSIRQTDGSAEGHVWISETKRYTLFQRNTLPMCASDEHAGPVVASALQFIHLLTLPSCG